ncbi:tRNA pseudouridine synthase A, partial [Yersinia pestis PY-12]
MATAG